MNLTRFCHKGAIGLPANLQRAADIQDLVETGVEAARLPQKTGFISSARTADAAARRYQWTCVHAKLFWMYEQNVLPPAEHYVALDAYEHAYETVYACAHAYVAAYV